MGPLVTREHRDRVASYLDAAIADGATVDGRWTATAELRSAMDFSWALR